jgi:hypothetical protein
MRRRRDDHRNDNMALSKLDLALVAIMAAGLIWIEHSHRVAIGTLAAAEAVTPAASVCPKTDDAPFSPECIKFISGGVSPVTGPRPPAAPIMLSARVERRAELRTRCPPGNEGAPDGDSCFRHPSADAGIP